MVLKSLILLPVLGVSLCLAGTNDGYYMQPAIRGGTLVFVSQGDLWEVGLSGGLAHALTSHVAPASNPVLSPDGKWVAFTGTYEGPRDVYIMPTDGGQPKRLTYDGGMLVQNWTSNGILAACYERSTLPDFQLADIDPQNGRMSLLPLSQGAEGDFEPTGKTLFFTRFQFQGSHTKRYEGGTAQNLWKYTAGSAEAIPLTKSYPGTSKGPMVWKHHVYFLSDRDGTMNLWCMDEDGGSLKQLTRHVGWDIQSASMDAGRIAYQLGADIWVLDVQTGADAIVPITLASDFDQTRDHWVKNPMEYVTSVSAANDGSKVALTARGQVFVVPAEPGRLVDVTKKQGVRYRNTVFMPDGKSLLAISDESGETEWWKFPTNGIGAGERITTGSADLITKGAISPDGKLLAYSDKDQELYVCDLVTKKSTKLLSCPDGEVDGMIWSPDSQWLAFTMPTQTFSRIMIYSAKSGQIVPVTTARADSTSAAWSPDGKWLYFLSDRTFHTLVPAPWGDRQPEPFYTNESKIYAIGLIKNLRSPFDESDELYKPPKENPAKDPIKVDIDFDGLSDRLWEVPISAGNYSNLTVNGERLFVQSDSLAGSHNLAAVDIKDHDASIETLVGGISGYGLTEDGKKLLVMKNGGFFVASSAGPAALSKPVDLSGWTLMIDPRQEWHQMFVEAWRLHRDFFYDRHMNAVDWKAMLNQYLPLVDRVRDRNELSNLLAQMVSELCALHTFVAGGDQRSPVDNIAPSVLGAVLTRDSNSGGYRVDKIYKGNPDYPTSVSPLSVPRASVHAGDVIQSVNGVDTLSTPDISALLRNQAGKQVLLGIKDGKTSASRQCIVKPISLGEAQDLRYTDWEISRRDLVEQESGSNIGYIHLRAMGSGDIDRWEQEFYPIFNRSGLIIDVRHNNGGNIDSWIIEKLMRKAWFYWQPRIGNQYWNMQQAFRGHVVVLCDESTASDGEAFTEGIKRNKLATVIGTRTWGGEIWLSEDNGLVDGGIASAAEYGVYGPEGKWLVEGHGVDPDIVVDDLPHDTFTGQDAQLQAAIDLLNKEIKEHPTPVPPSPPYPDKSLHPKAH